MIFDAKTGEWVAEKNSPEAQSLKNIEQRTRTIEHKTTTKKMTPAEIKAENMQNPLYAYAYHLSDLLYEMHEDAGYRGVRFNNSSRQCYYNPATKKITLGYHMIDDAAERGFYEPYKGTQWVWAANGITTRQFGKRAVWMIMLHEYAHRLQDVQGKLYKDSKWGWHHRGFQNILKNLIETFPYEDTL